MAKVLVIGGAGYVGSTTSAWLLDHGHEVWVLDDLSTGHREFVTALSLGSRFTHGNYGDQNLVSDLISRTKFDCVMHFGAFSLVGESVLKPEKYYENNVVLTQRLLETLISGGIQNFIFSSSCAVFGDPSGVSFLNIHESLPQAPLSPYGQNKRDVEEMLAVLSREKGLRSISLRYFNAAGAEPHLRVGEWHQPETHLIPKILKASLALAPTPIEIYGVNYPTPDGTCIRDYIHVWDLAASHGLAMERLVKMPLDPAGATGGVCEAYNLGSERGYSVRDVIQVCEEVTGIKLEAIEKDRRHGDPPRLVADSALAKKVLGFDSLKNGLKEIVTSAWAWEKKRSQYLQRAVFLDRDGTINEDPGYLSHPEQLHLIPGAGEALSLLKKGGYLLVVVSNQSGVGRGLIDREALPRIHRKLDELLLPWSVTIDRYELCLHHPKEECACRKPKPKLILDAAEVLRIDLARSFMIGDKGSDLGAGHAAGCRGSILVLTGEGTQTAALLNQVNQVNQGDGPVVSGEADFIANSLLDAAHWILAQGIANS